jgi:hypothetical protein
MSIYPEIVATARGEDPKLVVVERAGAQRSSPSTIPAS